MHRGFHIFLRQMFQQTPLAEAQLPMAELKQGFSGLALVPEFL
jgi:hypothetical protein